MNKEGVVRRFGWTYVWVVEDVCTDSDELSPSSVAFDWRRTKRPEEASPRGNAFAMPATKRRRTRKAGMMLRLRLVVSIGKYVSPSPAVSADFDLWKSYAALKWTNDWREPPGQSAGEVVKGRKIGLYHTQMGTR